MSLEILFHGLNQIGASIGMALADQELEVRRVGYDPDGQLARHARQVGAVDHLVSHPRKASEVADVVVLSTPITDVRDYFLAVGSKLKPNAVVLDTSPLKALAVAWAEEMLPEECHYIGVTPIVGPAALLAEASEPQGPRADLYHGGLMAIVIPPKTPEKAVTLALRFAAIIGATPFFIDPVEHDAVIATVDGLPSLIGAALMNMAAVALNWRELQRMAGSPFANATSLHPSQTPKITGTTVYLNRDIVLTKLDALLNELQTLHGLIAADDSKVLIDYLAKATATRDSWLKIRQHGDWAGQDLQRVTAVEKPGLLSSLFGIRPRRPKEHK